MYTLLEICPATLSNEQRISAENHSFLVPNVCHTGCPSKHNSTILESKEAGAHMYIEVRVSKFINILAYNNARFQNLWAKINTKHTIS